MNPLTGLIAPVLAVLPVATIVPDALPTPSVGVAAESGLTNSGGTADPLTCELDSFREAARSLREQQAARQVRIEQRIIIRIAPGGPGRDLRDPRRSLFADMPGHAFGPRVEERRMNQCVAVSGIAGVQPDGPSRLTLFMRDQRVVSAALDKACNARDFYSGFLVERSTDGMICAGRDKLLSRSGSNCALGKLHQMVVVDDDE